MSIDPSPIARLDVPLSDLEADLLRRTQALEQQIAETSARAHEAHSNPDGAHVECWHQFLDIDPDLRGRDYTQPGRAT